MKWSDLYEACRSAPCRPKAKGVAASVQEKMDAINSGRWTVEDVVEMHVDEISTAGSVGSGLDKGIGNRENEEEKWGKIVRKYEEYLAKTRTEASTSSAKKFLSETAPGLRDTAVKEFLEHLRGQGFRI